MASGQEISRSRAARPARGRGGLFIPAPAPPRWLVCRLAGDVSSLSEGAKGSPCSRLLLSPAVTGLETKPPARSESPRGTERSKPGTVWYSPSAPARLCCLSVIFFLLLIGLKLQGFTDFGLILSCFGMKINSLPSPSPF